jgi:hypothetical protein
LVALGIGSQELSAAGDPEDMYTLYALGSKCVTSQTSHVFLESNALFLPEEMAREALGDTVGPSKSSLRFLQVYPYFIR